VIYVILPYINKHIS